MNQPLNTAMDWSTLPAPEDDGAAAHLTGAAMPNLSLPATDGSTVDLSSLKGTSVVFVYPMTGRPDRDLPENWDMIPGARGCTPQACSFRDLSQDLKAAGADRLFGLSVQATDYQREAAERLHLPFALLSDASADLRKALHLPVMTVEGTELLKRMALIIEDGVIAQTFYPVFPPDRNAQDVLDWLQKRG
ncbi:peroxiredoxin [Pseudahrensia aquimaris]|uniref:Peroxiredoxin n=1 Tax=Pseudahrensia aquimaris TaxID=744461 RepID=A0ABW3FG70_9HYPH